MAKRLQNRVPPHRQDSPFFEPRLFLEASGGAEAGHLVLRYHVLVVRVIWVCD